MRQQTETAAFQRWFGGSVVRNEDGTPKVVYHGTPNSFDVFRAGTGDVGIHFGPESAAKNRLAVKGSSGYIIPVYLRMQSPLHLSDAGNWDTADDVVNVITDKMLADPDFAADFELAESRTKAPKGTNPFTLIFQKMGYDGIIYDNVAEGGGDSYIVFDPRQIKSADRNIGTFDPDAPSFLRGLRHR